MIAVKKINNNVIICRDSEDRELIALGKGLGFGEFPREVGLKEIERTFYDINNKFRLLIEELPSEIIEFSDRIIGIARNEISYELNPNQSLILADHIWFLLERMRKQIHVNMPLAYDVSQMYPVEYKIGKYAIQRLSKEFKIGIPPEEAVGIALNLLNGKINVDDKTRKEVHNAQDMLEEVTVIVEEHFHIIISRESFNYSRFATHLQFLFQRIQSRQYISSDNNKLYLSTRKEYPEIAECTDKLISCIEDKWNCQIEEEEKFYLMLHLNRIYVKEGL